MKGIDFLVDDKGKRKAVMIDLQEWGEAWEDLQDILVSISRMTEERVAWDELKTEMDRNGK